MQEDEDHCVGKTEREARERGRWMVPEEGIGMELPGLGNS